MLNHLIATKDLNLVKLERQFDFSAQSQEPIGDKVHIHAYDDAYDEENEKYLFAKSKFKDGSYDKTNLNELNIKRVDQYCLRMALEGKNNEPRELYKILLNLCKSKL